MPGCGAVSRGGPLGEMGVWGFLWVAQASSGHPWVLLVPMMRGGVVLTRLRGGGGGGTGRWQWDWGTRGRV
jgi:hypothetical protein